MCPLTSPSRTACGQSDAWDDIPPEMIAKLFRKCCITNALDGTEDEQIWEEESDSDPFEDLDEVDGDDQLYYADHFERQLALTLNALRTFLVKAMARTFMVSKQLQQLLNIEHWSIE